MRRRSLFGLQNRICGLPWCSPNSSKQYYFRHIAPKTAPYEANGGTNSDFIPMLCENNGIISFPYENSHFLVVTSSLCHPNSASLRSKLHIEPLPRLTIRLLSLTAPLRRCFVLYTFSKGADNLPIRTDKMCPNHSYCSACRCSTTGDVALDAFNSNLFCSLNQISS